jgi:competence protein ComFC
MNIIDSFLDFIFPAKCLICGRLGEHVCKKCISKYLKNKIINHCLICAGPNSIDSNICETCKNEFSLDNLIILFEANEITDKLIYEIKYNYNFYYAEVLFGLIKKSSNFALFKNHDCIFTSIPLHKARYNKRGFNQSEIIAKLIAKDLNDEYIEILKRGKNTKPQVGLSKIARKKNIKNAFELQDEVQIDNKEIILLDDVFTTGSTMKECASKIRSNYQAKIIGCVISKGT